MKAAVPAEDLKKDLLLKKASELVISSAQVGEAPKAEEAPAEKPKRTRKKKTEEPAEEPKAE